MRKPTIADKVWYMCEGAATTICIFWAAVTLSLMFLALV